MLTGYGVIEVREGVNTLVREYSSIDSARSEAVRLCKEKNKRLWLVKVEWLGSVTPRLNVEWEEM